MSSATGAGIPGGYDCRILRIVIDQQCSCLAPDRKECRQNRSSAFSVLHKITERGIIHVEVDEILRYMETLPYMAFSAHRPFRTSIGIENFTVPDL